MILTTLKRIVKKIAEVTAQNMPWQLLKHSRIIKRFIGDKAFEQMLYRKFGEYLIKHKAQLYARFKKNKRVMIIREGIWGNAYFNVACLNNTLNQILYALLCGYIPVVKINQDNEKMFSWEWFFLQPGEVITNNRNFNTDDYEKVDCDIKTTEYYFDMGIIYQPDSIDYKIWKFLYDEFVKLNEETKRYINSELIELGDMRSVLGVLVRGTDYLSLRPKGHPIQPEMSELVLKCKQYQELYGFKKLYVATEDKRLLEQLYEVFGIENILVNRRRYYDELYKNGDVIGRVHFDRENDNYWKSIEYLSSMFILSECGSLVAGNCGGTTFAMLKTSSYESPFVFDKGNYQ